MLARCNLKPGTVSQSFDSCCRMCGARQSDGVWRSLVSALALGARGRRFESGHPDCLAPSSEGVSHESLDRAARGRRPVLGVLQQRSRTAFVGRDFELIHDFVDAGCQL